MRWPLIRRSSSLVRMLSSRAALYICWDLVSCSPACWPALAVCSTAPLSSFCRVVTFCSSSLYEAAVILPPSYSSRRAFLMALMSTSVFAEAMACWTAARSPSLSSRSETSPAAPPAAWPSSASLPPSTPVACWYSSRLSLPS
ncbi:hypothetical protein D3C71_1736040 [compost metagenome]